MNIKEPEIDEVICLPETKLESWDLIIKPKYAWFNLNLADVWQYRDLLMLMVRRDLVSVYKQTILGPFWFFIQPLLTTIMFIVVFGNIAKISTDSLPPTLFYMSGIVLWNYFSDCLNKTSTTFATNAGMFGKVYFPRIIMPLSNVITNFIRFGIQLVMFLGFYFYYLDVGANIHPNLYIFLMPLLLLIMALQGLGWGLIISALTTKYRDLTFLVSFGVQLLMYATPIIYPLSSIPIKYKFYILTNPLS